MKTVILDTPGTVTLSALHSTLPIGVCKDLLSPRGVIMKQSNGNFYVGEMVSHEELPATPEPCFYKDILIETLLREGFMVVQFDSAKEMFAWLGEEFVEIR